MLSLPRFRAAILAAWRTAFAFAEKIPLFSDIYFHLILILQEITKNKPELARKL
jgi:hypothetical protein